MASSLQKKHLRYAGQSFEIQKAALINIVRQSPTLMKALTTLHQMRLNDAWVVSGAIYNQVWNDLTGRPEMHGVKDVDVFYWDENTSYEAEDNVIQAGAKVFASSPPVEIRNQARVPLWYKDHFGHDYPAISSSREAIDNFASRTHCVGIRMKVDVGLELYAPYGLDDIFSFRLTPNTDLPNRETHEGKGARQQLLWPELTLLPWPST